MGEAERLTAAQAYVDALRTGDHSLAQAAAPYLAPDIAVRAGQRTFEGYDEALRRITGVWPQTPVYRKGAWGPPRTEDGCVRVTGEMMPMGAGVNTVNLTFWFNDADQISRVEQESVVTQPLVEGDRLPEFVKARVNAALASDTPLCVSYVDEGGRPHLSLRGSTQVFSDTQLAIWVRSRAGLAAAVEKNPNVSLLYRENATRSTLTFMGRARVGADEAVRKRVFETAPEVEQNHESWATGVALIIDLDTVDGATPEGRVKFRRAGGAGP